MRVAFRHGPSAGLALLATSGTQADVPPCDPIAAREVVDLHDPGRGPRRRDAARAGGGRVVSPLSPPGGPRGHGAYGPRGSHERRGRRTHATRHGLERDDPAGVRVLGRCGQRHRGHRRRRRRLDHRGGFARPDPTLGSSGRDVRDARRARTSSPSWEHEPTWCTRISRPSGSSTSRVRPRPARSTSVTRSRRGGRPPAPTEALATTLTDITNPVAIAVAGPGGRTTYPR